MRVTKWGEFGILCSLFLTEKHQLDQSAGAAEIAASQDIPLQYTQQILQRLRKGNIIESIRGPLGGYRLARSPEEISLKDILFAAEGHTFEVVCETNPVCTGIEGRSNCCGLKPVWRDLKKTIDEVLETKTLSQVFKNHQKVLSNPVEKNKPKVSSENETLHQINTNSDIS